MSESFRVVLAEDESAVAASVAGQLQAMGHRVIGEAGTGEEAVKLAAECRPDVIVMDIRMPDCDGIEAARRIAEQTPTPVVFLTGYFDSELLAGATAAGGLAYLLKPASSEQLAAALELARTRFAEITDLKDHIARLNEALEARKLVARAKGILMAHHGISENEAHKRMQREASRANRKLVDLARAIISAQPFMPDKGSADAERPRGAARS
ncbi:MAG: ANTAR domain-containing response regulator [Armatimonadota bacterium]